MIQISHRGFSRDYPENTMIAFKKAYEENFQWIEFDIQFSKDHKLVVIHDDTVDRTSNGLGKVSAFLLDELKRFDFGSWKGEQFHGERILELGEVFNEFAGKLRMNIEVKFDDIRTQSEGTRCKLISSLVEMIHQEEMEQRVILSSFNHQLLTEIHTLDSGLNLGCLVTEDSLEYIMNFYEACPFFSLHADINTAQPEVIDEMNKLGVKIFLYTVNNRNDWLKTQSLKVDGIFTDNPKNL